MDDAMPGGGVAGRGGPGPPGRPDRRGALPGGGRSTAVRLVGAARRAAPAAPSASCWWRPTWLTAPPIEVVVAGDRPDLVAAAQARCRPGACWPGASVRLAPVGRPGGRGGPTCAGATLPAAGPDAATARGPAVGSLASRGRRGSAVRELVAWPCPAAPPSSTRLRPVLGRRRRHPARRPPPARSGRDGPVRRPAHRRSLGRARGRIARDGGRPVEDGDALVMATSGTTGVPKGVVLTHDAVVASAAATSAHLGHRPRPPPLAGLPAPGPHRRVVGGGPGLVVTGTALRPCTDGFDADSAVAAARAGSPTSPWSSPPWAASIPPPFERIVLGGSAAPPTGPPTWLPPTG